MYANSYAQSFLKSSKNYFFIAYPVVKKPIRFQDFEVRSGLRNSDKDLKVWLNLNISSTIFKLFKYIVTNLHSEVSNLDVPSFNYTETICLVVTSKIYIFNYSVWGKIRNLFTFICCFVLTRYNMFIIVLFNIFKFFCEK